MLLRVLRKYVGLLYDLITTTIMRNRLWGYVQALLHWKIIFLFSTCTELGLIEKKDLDFYRTRKSAPRANAHVAAGALWPVMHEGRLMIPMGEKAVHVHHWMVCAALLPFLGRYPVVQGVVLVLLVQGLAYSERFSVVEPNPWR